MKMAVLKQRLHRKNDDGTYDTIYLENTSTNVLMNFAQTANPGVTLDSYLQSIGFGLTCKYISKTNIEDFASRTPGFYRGGEITGAPVDSPDFFYYIWLKDSDTYGKLIAFKYTNARIYLKRLNDGTWEDWKIFAYDPDNRIGGNVIDILNTNNSNDGQLYSLTTSTGNKLVQLRNNMNATSTSLYRSISIVSRDSPGYENPERMIILYDRYGTESSEIQSLRPLIIPNSGTTLGVTAGSSMLDIAKRGTGFYNINNPSDPPDSGTGFYTVMVIGVNSSGAYDHLFVTRTNGTIYHGVVNKDANGITWTQIYPATWN